MNLLWFVAGMAVGDTATHSLELSNLPVRVQLLVYLASFGLLLLLGVFAAVIAALVDYWTERW